MKFFIIHNNSVVYETQNMSLLVNFRGCRSGEFYREIVNTCEECPEG